MTDNDIWIVDDIVARPGQGKAFLQFYRDRYVPDAEKRGMSLVHVRVEPAMWLDDEPNRLLLIWSVPDTFVLWSSKQLARTSPEVAHFWSEAAPPYIISRSRAVMADADHLESLVDV